MNHYLIECDDCDGAGCWKCDDGLVEISEAQAEAINADENDPRIIIVVVDEPRLGDES